jgi:hypothetical protein
MDTEAGCETSDKGEEIVNSSDYGVHVHVNMIAVPGDVNEENEFTRRGRPTFQ